MESFLPPLAALDRVLESSLAPLLVQVPGAGRVVSAALARNSRRCRTYFARIRASDAETVSGAFGRALKGMERTLETKFGVSDLATKTVVERLANVCERLHPKNLRYESFFLTEHAAFELLERQQPEALLRALGLADVSALAKRYGALGALALTRYTEPGEWQDAYLAELARVPSSAFERRAVRPFAVDRIALTEANETAKRRIKPWSMGHSKETGLVICFTHDREARPHLPLLLFFALYYHYFFETTRVGESLGRQANKCDTCGEHAAAVIMSTRRTLSFLHPNIHSEALYWEHALAHLAAVFPTLGIAPYLTLLAHGDFVRPTDAYPTSLNLIDHLWTFALPAVSAVPYRYHFQEAFWSDVLRRLRQLSRTEISYATLHTLELDDVAFTEELLTKAAGPRPFGARFRSIVSSSLRTLRHLLGVSHFD